MENNFFLHKRPSTIHGTGIFSGQPIKKGEIFYSIPLDKIVNTPTPQYAHIGKGCYVYDDEVLNWVNHSCDPNTELVISTDQPYLEALRAIRAGEEVVCDYSQTEKGGTAVLCHCGGVNCRGYFLRIEK